MLRHLRAGVVRALTVTLAAATVVLALGQPAHAAALQPVSGFGSNPGNLAMYSYVPDGLPSGAPLVVALHGCGQTAAAYHSGSGWQKYADAWGFTVVYPQQQSANNFSSCFNWFEPGDQARGSGEPASIKSMVDYALAEYGGDPSRVYVTGLSAGGAMSAVLLADYPDVFAGGSVIGGIPYRCATSSLTAYGCMFPGTDKTPQQWGDLARNGYPGYAGPRPIVAIWHGGADYTVATANSAESRDQWTDVAGVAATPTETVALPASTTLEKYGADTVRRYTVAGMGHGTPVDPGTGADQCGTAGAFFLDTICSTWYDAVYFGLDS